MRTFAQNRLRTVTDMSVIQGGIARPMARIRVQTGGVLRTVYTRAQSTSAMRLEASPQFVFTSNSRTTGRTTAVPSNFTSPVRYAWTLRSSNSVDDPVATNPTNATTAFFLSRTDGATAVFDCVATDALGATATTSVTASFASTGLGPGIQP